MAVIVGVLPRHQHLSREQTFAAEGCIASRRLFFANIFFIRFRSLHLLTGEWKVTSCELKI